MSRRRSAFGDRNVDGNAGRILPQSPGEWVSLTVQWSYPMKIRSGCRETHRSTTQFYRRVAGIERRLRATII